MVYFEEALDFLIDHPQIQAEKGIGVCGISKGAEFGLCTVHVIFEVFYWRPTLDFYLLFAILPEQIY